jgi:hypothetical protein
MYKSLCHELIIRDRIYVFSRFSHALPHSHYFYYWVYISAILPIMHQLSKIDWKIHKIIMRYCVKFRMSVFCAQITNCTVLGS